MSHYDDLQRFRDKTHNLQHDFKDFSAQNVAFHQGDWALIKQLSSFSDGSQLTMGKPISSPYQVNPALFAHSESVPIINAETESKSDVAPVAPIASASILRDVSQTFSSVPAQTVMPVDRSDSLLPASEFSEPITPIEPAIPPIAPTNYQRLFAPKTAEVKTSVEKNQPLQSLLERIASCR